MDTYVNVDGNLLGWIDETPKPKILSTNVDEKPYMGKLGLDLEVSISSEVLKFYLTIWMKNLTWVN